MPRLLNIACLSCIALLAACASQPDIEIHPVPGAMIGTHYTFEVIPDRRQSPIGPRQASEARARIEKALGEEMQRRGYRQVESGADIQVEYVTYVTEEYQDLHDQEYRMARSLLHEEELPEQRDVPLRTGTLHVHLLHEGRALYEGIASGVVNGHDVSPERIQLAVKLLLAEVPFGPVMEDASQQ
jgi:hypothetical protein